MIVCCSCKSNSVVQAVWVFANSESLDGGEVVDEIADRCWDCGSEDIDYE